MSQKNNSIRPDKIAQNTLAFFGLSHKIVWIFGSTFPQHKMFIGCNRPYVPEK